MHPQRPFTPPPNPANLILHLLPVRAGVDIRIGVNGERCVKCNNLLDSELCKRLSSKTGKAFWLIG